MNQLGTRIFILLFTLILVSKFARAQEALKPVKTDSPLIIDGVLDEEIWQNTPMITGFKTFKPDYEMDMGFRTEVFMANDEDNLYFAFIAYDEPNKIKTSVAARDKIRDDDWIVVYLDTFNDKQTLYSFYVNPSGIQMDGKLAGGRDDIGIDMVWYSAGNITDEGYVIEIKIPFKSIRYRNDDPVVMGVIYGRKISRFSMEGTYPPLDPAKGANLLIQMQQIQYGGVKKFTLLEILPGVTYTNRAIHQDGELKTDINKAELSLTAKYGITSDLILDATINPDFSQVESDAGQIDINQRFDIFYPEKRPFFLEGNETFNFAETGQRDAIRSVVNTRTIVNPLTAAKLTGKVGARNTIASIFALDEVPPDEVGDGAKNAQVGVFRYKRSFKDDSYLGAVYTSRQLNGHFNRVAGLDGQIRLSKSSTLEAHYLRSYDRDSTEADVTRDYSAKVGYSRRTRKMTYGASIANISDFKSDVGFITRTETRRANVFVSPKIYFEKKLLKRIDPIFSATYLYDKPSALYEHSYWTNLRFTLIRNSSLSLSYNVKNEIFLDQKFNRNNFRSSFSSQITKRVFFNVSYGQGNKILYSSDDPYQGYGSDASASLNLQVSDNFNSEWRYTYSDFFRTSTEEKDYDFSIIRSKNTYQVNKYLFFRLIVEYNSFSEELASDFLASFTYIPGTVVHIGFGSLYKNTRWENQEYVPSNNLMHIQRGFFFKASYLFRK